MAHTFLEQILWASICWSSWCNHARNKSFNSLWVR